MATLKTRWLLSIWVLSLTEYFALAGPPAPPSPPECYIPCDKICQAHIHCTWEPRLDPQIQVNYSLYWKQSDTELQHVLRWANLSGFINRQHFAYNEDLHVWVQAKNHHGSANSSEAKFNPEDISKPSPPKITSSHQDPLEIFWAFNCQPQHFVGHCDVRHRTEEDPDWVMEEASCGSYSVHNPQLCTVYDFQVRCVCNTGLKSDWSAIHRATSKEMAPVGKLNVWMDCGIFPESSDCVLAFKKLPPSQACGSILGYEVRLSFKNSPSVLVNTTDKPGGLMVCKEAQCHFNSSWKDISSASVSAFNCHGGSVPSYLSLALTGIGENERDIDLSMTEEYLTLSWKHPHLLYDNPNEYVVQYKQAGRPQGQGFDWVRVPTNQTTATFKGQFKKYTPYQVSLLKVSHNQVHHLSSAVGYSLEGPPSKVPSFKVLSITATHATVTWEPIPLLEQNGTILCYQIGANNHEVYNVSASKTSKQLDLRSGYPGQEYKVWIRAVTAAGPGTNSTISFKKPHHNGYLNTILLGILLPVAVVICVIFLCVCQAGKKVCCLKPLCLYEKVPDPRNSNILKQMNDPLGWICIPVNEPHPKISLLEVVEVPSWTFKSNVKKNSHPEESMRPMVGDGSSQMDCIDDQGKDAVTEESHRADQKYGREAYSKIVDSDEERDAEKEREEDGWSSSKDSEEEPMEFSYEKHFMPTAGEILKVA
ncbi:interleukin 12 receptor, beta 2a, like [Cheilinus undulatus]|uniref:interleukin 12 receptor, beta 2a, like n=1 Tax=Cheilinus undulatus TaxID=241271 RepID=UPI001BD5EF79|nr:interleukin 12 receptor, beta 2a, like [Cheilinus undulatus]